MSSIHQEVLIDVPVARAWSVLRDIANAHVPFAGVLVDSQLRGDRRTVKFANGMVVQELIVDVDEQRQRIAYSVQGAPFEHHHASMRLEAAGDGRCRFVWISDFTPAAVREIVAPLVDAGCQAIKRNLERGAVA